MKYNLKLFFSSCAMMNMLACTQLDKLHPSVVQVNQTTNTQAVSTTANSTNEPTAEENQPANVSTTTQTIASTQPITSPTQNSQTNRNSTSQPVNIDSYRMTGSGRFILGSDLSFLQHDEDGGAKYEGDSGTPMDALQIFKSHGFDFIRLRLFVNPSAANGYNEAPYCDLDHTKAMALRLKQLGLGFLLDFHYSDTWADPAHQYKPASWVDANNVPLTGNALVTQLHDYTKETLLALAAQQTLPAMVQIGNEIGNGMLWPDGSLQNWTVLGSLITAGYNAVKEVDPNILVVIHIETGQNPGFVQWFAGELAAQKVPYDIMAVSAYIDLDSNGNPQSSELTALSTNLSAYITQYGKPVMAAEYTAAKQQINDIVYNLPDHKGLGTFIWEPDDSGWWGTAMFDANRHATSDFQIYTNLRANYTAVPAWP